MTRARDVANIDGLLTTTGDTYYASAAGTPARLGIGSSAQVLTVSGGVPSWATPAGGSFSGCRAVKTGSNQSISDGTATAVTLNTEDFDTSSYHDNSTNNTRMTVPSTGYYLLIGNIGYGSNSSGTRHVSFRVDGSSYSTQSGYAAVNGAVTVVCNVDVIYLTTGQYVEMMAYQNSGGALNIIHDLSDLTYFDIVKLG